MTLPRCRWHVLDPATETVSVMAPFLLPALLGVPGPRFWGQGVCVFRERFTNSIIIRQTLIIFI